MKVIAAIGVVFAILVIGVIIGHHMDSDANRTNPVCHSLTEDSVITDCDYRNGAWYRK